MPVDGLYPGFVKIFYETPTAPHTMTVPVNLVAGGMPGGTFELFQKNATQVNWVTGITALVTVLKAQMHTTVTFQYAELYDVPSLVGSPAFLDTTVLSIAGTNATAIVLASQQVYSYRTTLGGKGFIYLMDQSAAVNLKLKAPTYGGAGILAIVNYLIGSTSIVIGRDNGYPAVVTKVITKTNDALRRKYNLN